VSGTYNASDTNITLASGYSNLPAAPYNMVWYNSTDYADPSDDPQSEIVRVTSQAGPAITITRATEGPNVASVKNISGKTYVMLLTLTAKMITDIGNNLHKPWNAPVEVEGDIDGINKVFTLPFTPADPNSVILYLAQQPQLQGIHFTLSGTTITYANNSVPDASLATLGHYAMGQ
jgi:hypothetical protein